MGSQGKDVVVQEVGVPVHFFHIMRPVQKFNRNFMSAKLEILYDGNFLETMCWEIWVDADGFMMGVIMARYCNIILRFQGSGVLVL